jgi:hypothetical protein
MPKDQKNSDRAEPDETDGRRFCALILISSYVCFSSGAFYAYAWPFYVFFSFFRLA